MFKGNKYDPREMVRSTGAKRDEPSPKNSSAIKNTFSKMSSQDGVVESMTLNEVKSKAKSSLIDFLKHVVKIPSFTQQIFNGLQLITEVESLGKLFEHVFKLLKDVCAENEPEKSVIVNLRSKQAMKLQVMPEDDSKKKGKTAKIQEQQKHIEQLRKEMFTMREEKQKLEKRVVSLVEQFRTRKAFFTGEIKKLTDIINLSSMDIRRLAMEKTKEAHQLQQQRSKLEEQRSGPPLQLYSTMMPQQEAQETYPKRKTSGERLTVTAAPVPVRSRLSGVPSVQRLDDA